MKGELKSLEEEGEEEEEVKESTPPPATKPSRSVFYFFQTYRFLRTL